MSTLRNIAEKCGVDISTVSKVINSRDIHVTQGTREKILAVAKELNYRPNALARSLRLRKSGAIVMALRDTNNFVYPEIIDGAQEAAESTGVCLFLLKYKSGESAGASLISLVREGRVDGILWDDLPYLGFARELIEAGVPFVCLNGYADVQGQCVTLDDREGFLLQANYLADLGHRRIGFVGVEPISDVSILCLETFRTALQHRGIELLDRHIWHSNFEGSDVSLIADQIAAENLPMAIATASLSTAKRLSDALIRRGIRIPEDLSLIGYHDSPDAQWNFPALTTVKMPSRQQGAVAVTCLLDLIETGRFQTRKVPGTPTIVKRASCGRPSCPVT
jgi:LacI family transcriptional regulator